MKDIKETIKEELKEVEVPMIIDEENIKDLIYEIRDKKVMLDFDLARIYGYSTSAFNQQVKRNIERLMGEEFMFCLNEDEMSAFLVSQFVTAKTNGRETRGGRRNRVFAFTEQGVYMLMTVLRGPLAIKQSRALIKVFKELKDYAVETAGLLMNTNSYIESKFSNYDRRLDDIEGKIGLIMDNFNETSIPTHFLIHKNQRVEADIAYQSIYRLASHSLIIVDNYISSKTIELLKVVDPSISITILSDNVNKMENTIIDDFAKDTGIEIKIIPTHGDVHDRYIFIDYGYKDEELYHSGSSSKDSGNSVTTIEINEFPHLYHPLFDKMLKQ